jgi:transcriptional regulator of heat shock response
MSKDNGNNRRPTAKTRTTFKIKLDTKEGQPAINEMLMEPSEAPVKKKEVKKVRKIKKIKKVKEVKEVITKSNDKKYYFEDLKVEQSFKIFVEDGETVQLVKDRAVVASNYYMKKHRRKTGVTMEFKYWKYDDEGFVRVWRWK